MKKNYIKPKIEIIRVDNIHALIIRSEEEANGNLPTL